jgi:hypothetical protein
MQCHAIIFGINDEPHDIPDSFLGWVVGQSFDLAIWAATV